MDNTRTHTAWITCDKLHNSDAIRNGLHDNLTTEAINYDYDDGDVMS